MTEQQQFKTSEQRRAINRVAARKTRKRRREELLSLRESNAKMMKVEMDLREQLTEKDQTITALTRRLEELEHLNNKIQLQLLQNKVAQQRPYVTTAWDEASEHITFTNDPLCDSEWALAFIESK